MFLAEITYERLDGWVDHQNWDSIALLTTAVGTLILAAGVVIALVAFWDARRTRDGELVIELSERWNDPETIASRQLYSSESSSDIVDMIDRLYPPAGAVQQAPPDPKDVELFQKLVRWPALIETIGVLADHGAISTAAIFKMWGYSIASAWEAWRDAASVLRDRASYPGTFEYFEALAKAMQKQARKKAKKKPGKKGG